MCKHIVLFRGEELIVRYDNYNDNRIAMRLIDKDGFSYCMASINLPEYKIEPMDIIIKNYSENEGVLDALIRAGVVRVKEYIEIGPYCAQCAICKILKR